MRTSWGHGDNHHLVGDWQPLPQQRGDHLHDGLVQLGEPLQLLAEDERLAGLALAGILSEELTLRRRRHLCAVVAAVLDDPLHLLVHQLHTAQARLLQALHLLLYKQLEGDLGHEKGRARTLGEKKQTSNKIMSVLSVKVKKIN